MVQLKLVMVAEPIQDPMEADCARITGTSSEEAWRLLLQLDWDPAADMEWGDTGRLYFWVREADLQAGALDRAWCILQSH